MPDILTNFVAVAVTPVLDDWAFTSEATVLAESFAVSAISTEPLGPIKSKSVAVKVAAPEACAVFANEVDSTVWAPIAAEDVCFTDVLIVWLFSDPDPI